MGERVLVRLADACESIDYGFTASASDHPVGPKFLRITDIINGPIAWASVPYCDADEHQTVQFALGEGDVVVARTGATVGTVGFVREPPGAVFASYLVRLRAGPGLESRYLFYCLKTPAWHHHIDAVASGKSAQPNASASAMAQFSIPVPAIGEQRAIAEMLGALDDKIESNRRLSTLLHSIARTEFGVWRAGVDRWNPTTFGDFAAVYGGSTPRTTEPSYWGGLHAWVTPTDVTSLVDPYFFETTRTITDAGLASCSTELHPPGSIFMTSRATIGAFAVNQVPCAANQGFIVVRPLVPTHRWFLFHEMQDRVPDMLDLANGSTFLEISRGSLKSMGVDVPADPVTFERLADLLEPLHARACAAASESRDLAALRDALLPELLSGRLRVPEAERLVEAVS